MWRPTLAVAALALALAGCGHTSSQRGDVATYLKQVNRIEHALTEPLSTVASAGKQFAHEQRSGGSLIGLTTASHEQALQHAWAQIMSARSRLAAIRVPAPAAHLQSLLTQVVIGQAQLTHELAQLVAFLPRYSQVLRPLVPAIRRLQSSLDQQSPTGTVSVASIDATKAAALRRFTAKVDGIVGQLHQLHPPPVQKPAYRTQLVSLRGMSSSAGQLAGALEAGTSANLRGLLLRFERAETLAQTVPAQKAEIAAVRAYDAQSVRLARLSQAAEQERVRLDNNLT
jgi:hypothetical protein